MDDAGHMINHLPVKVLIKYTGTEPFMMAPAYILSQYT